MFASYQKLCSGILSDSLFDLPTEEKILAKFNFGKF